MGFRSLGVSTNSQKGASTNQRPKRKKPFEPSIKRPCYSEEKAFAITPELTEEMARTFGDGYLTAGEINQITNQANGLALESSISGSASMVEYESVSTITAVGIGFYKRGHRAGFVLVDNEAKSGLGFPGGTVRPGESPKVALHREIQEEVGMEAIIGDLITEFRVGDDGHKFQAYRVEFVGGKPTIPTYSKEEPITNIVFASKESLEKVCQTGTALPVRGNSPKGILRSHRLAFLQFAEKRG